MENRLRDGTPLPDKIKQYEKMAHTVLAHAKGGVVEVEQKLALNANFQKTTYFGKDVWLRNIADVVVTKGDKAFIGDWKTGKIVPDSNQLELGAAVIFAHKPWVKKIVNAFLWLKEGKTTTESYDREDVPAIWQKFLPRVARMTHAIEQDKFPPKPSGLCRAWCPCVQCPHNGKYTGPEE